MSWYNDIEGTEKFVLSNMIGCDVIPDVICIEVGYEWDEKKDLLKNLGYRFDFFHYNNAYCSKPKIHVDVEKIKNYNQLEWYYNEQLIYNYEKDKW